jgi:hypothetical protein
MSDTPARIRALVGRGEVLVSVHGFRELAADDILLDDITGGVDDAVVVEEYAEAFKGPAYWYCSMTSTAAHCMCCGGFRKEKMDRQRLLPPTGHPSIDGPTTS